ncbi:MAG: hypothetical protein DWQ47_02925 [Acidobacteria bacterium]|nr:MAG: hypothetical protein DWQ32_06475 [Acidobacteriota bacterium]REK01358.1 MAG: hypothetical protein DWQ38_02910 [Acidobacteriota bacterium]REK14314.1 MAG: hypothetical protein DWQ43_12165 [Acidobacteriota bacterium]REK45029.1 MAG: hypothetical protein DWQ47_02925 [Acidobacteriota bacterium]
MTVLIQGLIIRCSGADQKAFMDRPPPYFPQGSLNPKDENRYRKFKIVVGTAAAIGVLVLLGAIVGLYYLIAWLAG